MDVLTYYLNDTAPTIVRKLSTQYEGDFDVEAGVVFTLKVRPQWASTVTLSATMTPNMVADEVSYVLQPGDLDAEGIYRAWIFLDFGFGSVQSTDEFQINVFAHAPGQGTEIGAIWRACRALEPVAWDSLRNYPDYGDIELQRVIELAKLRVLPSAVAVADEVSLDPRVVDYIAKKALVSNVLSAAISFWTNQVIARTARGNSEEVETYPDRIRAAEASLARYRGDLAEQLPEIDEIIGPSGILFDAPMVNDMGPTLTPGLDEYPAQPTTSPNYYWRRPYR
jgi:hypothetical protein